MPTWTAAACCQTARGVPLCVQVYELAVEIDRRSPCFAERLRRGLETCGRSEVARSQTGPSESNVAKTKDR